MRKILAVILAIVIVVSLAACGQEKKAEKYCSSCGGNISKGIAFCEHCGTSLNDTKAENENTSSDNSSYAGSQTEETSNPTEISKPSTPSHTHSYSAKVIAATCIAQGYTIYTCSCSDTYKNNYTNPTSHNYSNYKCTKCGTVDKLHAYEYLTAWVKEYGKADGKYISTEFKTEINEIFGYHHYKLCYFAHDNKLFISRTGNMGSEESFMLGTVYLNDYFCIYQYNTSKMYGYITPNKFTTNTVISFVADDGDTNAPPIASQTICELIVSFKNFLDNHTMGITINDLGFTKL